MPQSLSTLLVHLVFSTKKREPLIRTGIESELHAYVAAVLKNDGCPARAIGGMADHVHVLFDLSRVKSMAEIVEELKTSTSKWIKTKGHELHEFHWQTGYGAFSVSPSQAGEVTEYIQNQQQHHRGRMFQDEYRALLAKHGVSYDERYVWDNNSPDTEDRHVVAAVDF